MEQLKPNAESFVIRSLGYLLAKDIVSARLNVYKAFELDPKRKTVREAVAKIDYFSALSPVALPSNTPMYPVPVDWSLVKRDNENQARLKHAAEMFRELSEEENDIVSKKHLQCWYLACLSNDPEHQESAAAYCRQILENDPTDFKVIEWAVFRSYDIDLESIEIELNTHLKDDNEDISHVLAYVNCTLALQVPTKAITVLEKTRSWFTSDEEITLWTSLYGMALVASGNAQEALSLIDQCDFADKLFDTKARALKAIANQTDDWQPYIDFTENAFNETGDSTLLFESCSMMGHLGKWDYIAKNGKQLVEEFGTSEALRLAAIAYHNCRRFEDCLQLLDGHYELFPGKRLPNDLRVLRVNCQREIGAIPDAIWEAEDLVRENPSGDNLLNLIQLYFDKGDLKKLAVTARQLLDIPEISQHHLIMCIQCVLFEDRDLAILLWNRLVSSGVLDEHLGRVIGLGFQLGQDSKLGPLLQKMGELANKGIHGFGAIDSNELVAVLEKKKIHSDTLVDAYKQGRMPIHVIAGLLRIPLSNLYHTLLTSNETAPNPSLQPSLYARHGGRYSTADVLSDQHQWSLNLDLTALLLAAHLDVLNQIENTFSPLRIPYHLVSALVEMQHNLSHHQPTRIQIANQVIGLKMHAKINVLESDQRLPDSYKQLIDEMGQDWVESYEKARLENGYTVCFLPLTSVNMSGPPTNLPTDSDDFIVTCQTLVESLYRNGPLSNQDYTDALDKIGAVEENPSTVECPPQSSVFLQGGTVEVLAEANLLSLVCDRFNVHIGKREYDGFRSIIDNQREIDDSISWLVSLRNRVSEGIGSGKYEVIPLEDPAEPEASSLHQSLDQTSRCLLDLLSFKSTDKDVVWCDDRYVNGYFNRENVPIIGINDVLSKLVELRSITRTEYFRLNTKLRAGNVRFIQIEHDEILHHLSEARIEDNVLIETHALTVLRRYIAATLLEEKTLQIPPLPEDVSNENGETAYILNLEQSVSKSIIELWSSEESEEQCVIKSNWLIDNLYMEYNGLLETIGSSADNQDDQYLVAISLSTLISRGFSIIPSLESDTSTRRKKYFDWLSMYVLNSRFTADPYLLIAVADNVKSNLLAITEAPSQTEIDEVVTLIQLFFEDLPSALREELSRDTDFMAKIGLTITPIAGILDFQFNYNSFLDAASKAINGSPSNLTTVNEDRSVTIQPTSIENDVHAVKLILEDGREQLYKNESFNLLLDSPQEREDFLRTKRMWFDCSSEQYEKEVAEIVSSEDPRNRIDRLQYWLKKNVKGFYSKLTDDLKERPSEISLFDFRPPSAEGLMDCYRITPMVGTGEELIKWLGNQVEDIALDEGVDSLLQRFTNLPIPLPSELVTKVLDLPDRQQHSLLKDILSTKSTPLTQLHVLNLLIQSGKKDSPNWKLAKETIQFLVSKEGKDRISAFVSILTWVSVNFEFWNETRSLPSHIRLLLVWGHANQLYGVLTAFGYSNQWLESRFNSAASDRLLFAVLGRDSGYWLDVAHPRLVRQIPLLLHGMHYCIGDRAEEFIDDELRDVILDTISVESSAHLNPSMYMDYTLAENSLSSFLGKEFGGGFVQMLGDGFAMELTKESLQRKTVHIVEKVQEDPNRSPYWMALLQIALNDLPLPQNVHDQVAVVVSKTDFLDVYKQNPSFGTLVIHAASLLSKHVNSKELSIHLRTILLDIVEYTENEEVKRDPDGISSSRELVVFLEIAYNLASIEKTQQETINQLAETTSRIVDVKKKDLSDLMFFVQLFCKELPVNQARKFWPIYIKLRSREPNFKSLHSPVI